MKLLEVKLKKMQNTHICIVQYDENLNHCLIIERLTNACSDLAVCTASKYMIPKYKS